MSENYEIVTPEIDNVIIQDTKIGLTISQNGSELFYFDTEKDIDIISVDVKVITPALSIDNVVWSENNGYSFTIGDVKKNKNMTSHGKYQHSVLVKMMDSPIISCFTKENSDLYLRFYIYYVFEGIERRIIADTTKPENKLMGQDKGEYIKYYSETYKDRALLPYSIQLDSIYRPFFYNSALLFFDGSLINNQDITTQDDYETISGNTYAKFYFSIANGCTLRDKDMPIYRIGDINLKISNIGKGGVEDTSSKYEFTIKDNFRVFSEIEDFNDTKKDEERRNLLKNAHIRGIREAGLNDGPNDFTHSGGKIIEGGIFLPQVKQNEYFNVEHTYNNCLIPNNITYLKNGEEINVYDINVAQTFNTLLPLNIEMNINDASPDGINFKSIGNICEYITFPEEIKFENNMLKISYNGYTDDITYIHCNIGHLKNIYEILGKMNVNDYISTTKDDNDIFNYLYYGLKNNILKFNNYKPDEKCYWEAFAEKPEYVLAIYHGGYESDEELLKYIKHTNKLLIMRLYKL